MGTQKLLGARAAKQIFKRRMLSYKSLLLDFGCWSGAGGSRIPKAVSEKSLVLTRARREIFHVMFRAKALGSAGILWQVGAAAVAAMAVVVAVAIAIAVAVAVALAFSFSFSFDFSF